VEHDHKQKRTCDVTAGGDMHAIHTLMAALLVADLYTKSAASKPFGRLKEA
jgi:hypothetical protein